MDNGLYSYRVTELQQCAGCRSLKLVARSSDDTERIGEDANGEPEFSESESTLYPRERARQLPAWLDSLPPELARLLAEVYRARDVNARSLVAMGIRTIFDAFARETIGDVGSFEEKLKRLVGEGTISKPNQEHLRVVVDAGSAAGHRGATFSEEQVDHMLDAVEHLLQGHYAFRNPSTQLRAATPKRD